MELSKENMAVSSNIFQESIRGPIEGQKVHTVLLPVMSSVVQRYSYTVCYSTNKEACQVCSVLKKFENDTPDFFKKVSSDAYKGEIAPDIQDFYRQYEPKLLDCLNTMTIRTDKPSDYPNGFMNPSEFLPVLDVYVEKSSLYPAFEGKLGDYWVSLSQRMKDDPRYQYDPTKMKFLQAVKALEDKAHPIYNQNYQKRVELDAKVKSQGLGWFTYEQEADNLAGETLNALGFDGRMGGDFALAFAQMEETDGIHGWAARKSVTCVRGRVATDSESPSAADVQGCLKGI